ncbi:MAG TPA: hypothetical protein VFX49_13300 [Chloroflexota bacterium]|nr:hypothetical protein [Chloroflexota bacterium]
MVVRGDFGDPQVTAGDARVPSAAPVSSATLAWPARPVPEARVKVPSIPRITVLVAALCAAALLLADPAAALRLIAPVQWVAGHWRTLLDPLLAAALLAALALNARHPGALAAWLRHGVPALLRALPIPVAAAIAVLAFLLAAGTLDAARLARLGAAFGLQVLLVPETPPALVLVVLLGTVLSVDARRGRAALSAWIAARRALPALGGWWRRVAPPLVAAFLGGALCATLFPSAMQGWARPDPADAERYNAYRSFFNYSIGDDPQLESRTGFGLGLRGLTLPPGGSGSITFRFTRPPDSLVLLKADFYNRPLSPEGTSLLDETYRNALEMAAGPAGTFQPVARDVTLGEIAGGRVLDLSPLLGSTAEYRLRFSAVNTLDREVTALPSFVISTVVDPLTAPHGTFVALAYSAVAGAAVTWTLRRSASAAGAWRHVTVGLAAAALVSLAARAAGMPAARAAFGAVVVSIGAFGLVRSRSLRVCLTVACLAVAAVATDARWQELMRVRYEFLLPDAVGYKGIAAEFPDKMAHYRLGRPSALFELLEQSGYDHRASALAVFYGAENNGREPAWPALLRLVFNVLGVSSFHGRLVSLALSVLAAALTCWLGWRALHPLVGVAAGLVYALNTAQIANSVAGLREELVTVLFVGLVAVALAQGVRRAGRWPEWGRVAVAGVLGAGLVLVRADMLVLTGTVFTLAALLRRWRWREWTAACLLLGLLAGPMYLGYWWTRLDPFYPGTYGATVNRNLEFPERVGQPGYASPEAYAANWAAGPPISPMTYFFGLRPPSQFVQYTATGLVRIFPTILFRAQPVTLWLFLAGAALLLLLRRWLVPGTILLGLLPFYAFLAGVPNPWVFAPRYAHHVLPFAALAAGTAAVAPLFALHAALARRGASGPVAVTRP